MSNSRIAATPQHAARTKVSSGMRRLLDLLFPPVCVACGDGLEGIDAGPPLCYACCGRLAPQRGDVCRRCSAPIAAIDIGREDCPHCRGSRFHFDGVTALGAYAGPLREAVLRLKHTAGGLLTLALGQVLAERVTATHLAFDLVVPMPMHWLRRLIRGVNNPELLAERIAHRLGVSMDRRVLRFRHNIRQQSTLAPTIRRRNVRRALAVSPAYDLTGARILLVDDILTTGATASAAAKALKRAKANSVHVAVVARGVGFD